MASARIKTCFISAPVNVKIVSLIEVLQKHGVRVLNLDDTNSYQTIDAAIVDVIDRADLVIGVLSRTKPSQNVIFELGVAIGRRKQVVVFAPPGTDLLPFDLGQFLVVRASLKNFEAISFALAQVLSAPERTVPLAVVKQPNIGKALNEQVDTLLERYRSIMLRSEESQLEPLVAHAIRASGVEFVSDSSENDRRVDLAVWSDALQNTVGNPLLIEIKRAIVGRAEFKNVTERLAGAVRDAGAIWGLVLYGNAPEKASNTWATPPNVLVMSVLDLLYGMRTRSFEEVVSDLRNRRVHGLL